MRRRLLSAAAPILACLAACDPSAGAGTGPSLSSVADPSAVVFLTRDAGQVTYMDALFKGRVTRDAQGCLRLDTSERHTVIWPHGYSLEARGGTLIVRDEQGRDVGAVGGSFRIGGGEVPSLDFVDQLSAGSRAQAEESCPGRFWVAAPGR